MDGARCIASHDAANRDHGQTPPLRTQADPWQVVKVRGRCPGAGCGVEQPVASASRLPDLTVPAGRGLRWPAPGT